MQCKKSKMTVPATCQEPLHSENVRVPFLPNPGAEEGRRGLKTSLAACQDVDAMGAEVPFTAQTAGTPLPGVVTWRDVQPNHASLTYMSKCSRGLKEVVVGRVRVAWLPRGAAGRLEEGGAAPRPLLLRARRALEPHVGLRQGGQAEWGREAAPSPSPSSFFCLCFRGGEGDAASDGALGREAPGGRPRADRGQAARPCLPRI